MSEAKDKVLALAILYDRLKEEAEMKRADGCPQAQATRLVAFNILEKFKLGDVLLELTRSAEWRSPSAEEAAQEAAAENSLGAALDRYSASLSGRPQPVISRVGFEQVWEASTGTKADVIDPFFAATNDLMIPLVAKLLRRVDKLLRQADDMPHV